MSKTTITLHDYIVSEFSRDGRNEVYDFFNLNNPEEDFGMLWDDDEDTYMNKILTYDEETQEVLNNRIFRGLSLTDAEADRQYKQMFLFRYMNQQIGFQTVEEFSSRVMFIFMSHKQYLDYYHKNLSDMLQQKSENKASGSSNTEGTSRDTGNSTTDSNNRSANVTLPQNQPFMDLNDTRVEYADDTQADLNRSATDNLNESTNESESTNTNEGESITHSLDELNKIRNILKGLIDEYESDCFLLIW